MAEYDLRIGRSAERELENLEPQMGRRILAAVETLASEPRPRQARKLVGSADSFRLRIGQYRVLYQVDDSARMVTVIAVGHRRDIYR